MQEPLFVLAMTIVTWSGPLAQAPPPAAAIAPPPAFEVASVKRSW